MLRRRCVILILLETVLQALLISAIVIIFALDNAHCLAGAGCP